MMIPPEPPEGPRRGARKRVEPEDAALHRQSDAAKREAKRAAKEPLRVKVLRFSALVAQLDELQQEVRRILAELPPESAHHVTSPPPLTMTRPMRRWTPST